MEFEISKEKIVYDGVLKIKKAKIIHDSFTKKERVKCNREILVRGDAVAVIVYEKNTNSMLFTRQFRYATTKSDGGWIIEVPAGCIEAGESPVSCAKREVLEELGYQVGDMEFVACFYSSPGGLTERIFLYSCEVNTRDKVEKGGGALTENEDIELLKFPVNELSRLITSGKIKDAKSIIGIQWWLLNKAV